MNVGWSERNQQDATNPMFIIKLLSQHVSGIIMPNIREQDRVLLHVVFCTGRAGCGCVELGRKLFALCEGYCSGYIILYNINEDVKEAENESVEFIWPR